MAELSAGSQAAPPNMPEPAPAPEPEPEPQPQPQTQKTETLAQSNTRVQQQFMYKNRLQEYTQKLALPLPIYQTVNEGAQHAPRFRSTVLVDGSYYTCPNTFSHRKAAEQDVARFALLGVTHKIKDQGSPLIREDTVFCKSILNEYAVKTNLEKPTYNTIQPEGLLPVFVSSLVFNGVAYTGDTGRSKKEAEQLAARAVILSILDSESETVISEIIKSKFKLYAALDKFKDSYSIHNGTMPVQTHAGYNIGAHLSKGPEYGIAGGSLNAPLTAIPEPPSVHPTYLQATHPPLQTCRPEPSSEAIAPIIFVHPVPEQHLIIGPTIGRKRNRKNNKKAKKKGRVDAQSMLAIVPFNQVPSCSVAQ